MTLSLYPLLCAMFLAPADTRPWYAFTDTLTDRIGFKDASGKIRVPARFTVPTSAQVFRNVVAVAQEDSASGRLKTHFLRKDGSAFGHDSVPFLPDFYLPCEEDGRILFKVARSHRPGFSDSADRLGYFDSTGKIAIPARFVSAGRFRGGYAIAKEEGTLLCEGGKPWSEQKPCEHPGWLGESVLIDRSGRVVARPFDLGRDAEPDWSRAKVVDSEPDTNRVRIPLLDGRILSMPDIEREFRAWFSRELPSWRRSRIGPELFFRKLYTAEEDYWILPHQPNIEGTVWSGLTPKQFLSKNRFRFAALLDTLSRHLPDLAFWAQEDPLFGGTIGMFDDCGQADRLRFPTVRVMWDPDDNVSRREVLFVRTEAGYKIIEVH